MSLLHELRTRLSDALQPLTPRHAEHALLLKRATDPRFGDYQANCAMPLKAELNRNPREIAEEIVSRLNVADVCEPPEIAGPGFINFRLRPEAICSQLARFLGPADAWCDPPEQPRTVIVDFSSPNVAKPMHVGHIRSTVIGDALARLLRFAGHKVITDNHLGDWGTQFGMVIYGYKHFVDPSAFADDPVTELGRLYKYVNAIIGYQNARAALPTLEQRLKEAQAEQRHIEQEVESSAEKDDKKSKRKLRDAQRRSESLVTELREAHEQVQRGDSDPSLAAAAAAHPDLQSKVLEETALLHRGDQTNVQLWQQFLPTCIEEIEKVYRRLGITFDHQLGESFYNPMLPRVVETLRQQGLAKDSEGAICVFVDGFETPMIVQKRDGAFLYATTDLATLQYRRDTFAPDQILYVVDHRQSEHFEKLFAVADAIGCQDIDLRHIAFGTVLGEDGRPFKTRSGTAAGLEPLLDEAVKNARDEVCNPERVKTLDPPLTEAETAQIAGIVGHGAIKFADLSHNRTSDYVFNLKAMVSLDGQTSAYIQYAYARIRSVLRAAGEDTSSPQTTPADVLLETPFERDLGLALARMPEVIDQCLEDFRPNVLADYLYEIAKRYASFYENCPVLKAESPQLRESRLRLCKMCGNVLEQGLALLGIDVVERM